MLSSKREGYWVPGVETKLSARLLAGESSNLMCGVVDIVNDKVLLLLWWDVVVARAVAYG